MALYIGAYNIYGCESWTLRKNKETRLDAFQTKALRKILRVLWTAKKANSGCRINALINVLRN